MLVDLAVDNSLLLFTTDSVPSSFIIVDSFSCFGVDNDDKPNNGDPQSADECGVPLSGTLDAHDWEPSRWWTRYGSGLGSR